MPSVAWLVVLLIVALSFSFLSGINDAGNMMASMLSARAMRPLSGLMLVVVMELLGPLVFGTAVAATIGRGLIMRAAITPSVIVCAAMAATVWTLATSYLSLPSSMSHALLGGLLGSVLVDFSPAYVKWVQQSLNQVQLRLVQRRVPAVVVLAIHPRAVRHQFALRPSGS